MAPTTYNLPLIDVHSHHLNCRAIVNADTSLVLNADYLYSVGIHPWNVAEDELTCRTMFDEVARVAIRKQVVAIGEVGLDKLKGARVERQLQVLKWHLSLSRQMRLPVILHVVKALDEILSLNKEFSPHSLWIVHGFRGNEIQAMSLVKHGIALSFGSRFNCKAVAAVPDDRLFLETDDSNSPIEEIVSKVAAARGVAKEAVEQIVAYNIKNMLKSVSLRKN